MWTGLLLGAAFAQGGDPTIDPTPEEVVVYGDDFARWDHTRWLVNSELILPIPLMLGADDNFSFFSYAMQIRMVLMCDKDGKQTRKRVEVMCEIEDLGLLATSVRHWKRDKDKERVARVLDEIDAKLTGAKVQLQVDFKGGVNNVGIEGLTADNQRQRDVNENLRQLLLRVVAGFHMRIPDHAQRKGQWYEYNSNLMSLPSLSAARGSTTMSHTVSRHLSNGYQYQLVQTLGQGSSQVSIPNWNASAMREQSFASEGAGNVDRVTMGGDLGSGPPPPSSIGGRVEGNSNFQGKESGVDATYKLETTGVAVFDRESGIMTERVWATYGTPTASSGGGTLNNMFRNIGQLRMLGETEAPPVGATGQVSWPFQKPMEGLHAWTDLDIHPK